MCVFSLGSTAASSGCSCSGEGRRDQPQHKLGLGNSPRILLANWCPENNCNPAAIRKLGKVNLLKEPHLLSLHSSLQAQSAAAGYGTRRLPTVLTVLGGGGALERELLVGLLLYPDSQVSGLLSITTSLCFIFHDSAQAGGLPD